MTPEQVAAVVSKLLEASAEHTDATPVAVALIFNNGDFAQAGLPDRDRETTAKTYIQLSLSEMAEIQED